MKVGLFTDTYYPEINGVATSTQQLKRGLEALGHEVYVFAPEVGRNRDKDKNVIRKYSVPFLLLKDRRVCLFRMRKALREIERLNLDIVHSQTEFVMGHLARLTATKFNIPQIHTYHTVYEDYTHYLKIPGNNSEIAKNIVRKLSKILCERVDSIIVPTDKVKDLLKSYNVKKDIYIQPTGVDYNKFSNPDLTRVNQLKEKYGIKSDNKVLVFAGRMSKEKNVAEIVKFFSELIKKQPDTFLVIVGEGPEMSNLQNKVRKLGIDKKVVFTGPISWDVMENYYALGDIFVCASTSETQGLTYIEALSSNKPLLVRWDNCLEGVLKQGENGMGYNNLEEFIKGYFEICNDYDNMVKNCSSVAKKFSDITFAENVLKIYNTVKNNY